MLYFVVVRYYQTSEATHLTLLMETDRPTVVGRFLQSVGINPDLKRLALLEPGVFEDFTRRAPGVTERWSVFLSHNREHTFRQMEKVAAKSRLVSAFSLN